MELPNGVKKLYVPDGCGIVEALDIEWSSRGYPGQPEAIPSAAFALRTHGALKLTFENGDILYVGTSEWCDVEFWGKDEQRN